MAAIHGVSESTLTPFRDLLLANRGSGPWPRMGGSRNRGHGTQGGRPAAPTIKEGSARFLLRVLAGESLFELGSDLIIEVHLRAQA